MARALAAAADRRQPASVSAGSSSRSPAGRSIAEFFPPRSGLRVPKTPSSVPAWASDRRSARADPGRADAAAGNHRDAAARSGVEHAAPASRGFPVDARIESGRTPIHALQRLWQAERFDRIVVPAPIGRRHGFTPVKRSHLDAHPRTRRDADLLEARPDARRPQTGRAPGSPGGADAAGARRSAEPHARDGGRAADVRRAAEPARPSGNGRAPPGKVFSSASQMRMVLRNRRVCETAASGRSLMAQAETSSNRERVS